METSVNNKCRAFTSLEQSNKLAEILPLESADMRYAPFGNTHPWVWNEEVKLLEKGSVPCWSLAALLDALSDYSLQTNTDGTVFVVCESKKPMISDAYDNPIDACVDMIIKLKELNLL